MSLRNLLCLTLSLLPELSHFVIQGFELSVENIVQAFKVASPQGWELKFPQAHISGSSLLLLLPIFLLLLGLRLGGLLLLLGLGMGPGILLLLGLGLGLELESLLGTGLMGIAAPNTGADVMALSKPLNHG